MSDERSVAPVLSSLPVFSVTKYRRKQETGNSSEESLKKAIDSIRAKALMSSFAFVNAALGTSVSSAVTQYYLRHQELSDGQGLDSFIYPRVDQKSQLAVFKEGLIDAAKNDSVEYGFASSAQNLLQNAVDADIPGIDRAVQEIYVENYKSNEVMVGLLRAIANVHSPLLAPCIRTMILGALAHKSVEVKETAIRVVEYWGDKGLAEAVSATELTPDWLDTYSKKIVRQLLGVKDGIPG